eukprot:CAMPEP_0184357708 /NCGR_PEP_ID=MMETSP1089-20130417/110350_1 /TAXON_ID=38269 ORGANISM="Gloeochaete wittrockiana, Strain SAG46.84" /NCGR_SAMPLE_ID=MMETSP1089 /ASSEMBLY_ACC=CAM_ASM_000445 /LENGTH=60 /DNA_ID=CAMNT_0026695629 /DNA_START=585 /DNA_END=767 /DNA_ORIENTATION=+
MVLSAPQQRHDAKRFASPAANRGEMTQSFRHNLPELEHWQAAHHQDHSPSHQLNAQAIAD